MRAHAHAHGQACAPAPLSARSPILTKPQGKQLKGATDFISWLLDLKIWVHGHLVLSLGACTEGKDMMLRAYGRAQLFTFMEVKKQRVRDAAG